METNKLYLNTKSFVLAFDEYLTGLIALDSEYINIKSGVINDETIKKYKSKHNNLASEFFTKTRELTKSGGLDIQMENFKVNSDESKIKNYSKVMSNDFERLSYRLSEHQQKIVKSYSFLLETSIDTTTYFSGLNILFNHLFGVELSNTDNQLNKSSSTPEPKGVYDFFDEVINSEISDIEIYNYIEKATNNFDEVKTKVILKDLDFYLFSSKMELESECDLNDLVGKDKQYKSIDEIPYRNIKNIETGEIDKTLISYDYEKLFYPYLFYNLYRLKKMLLLKLNTEIKITQESLNNPYVETKKIIPKFSKEKNQQGFNETPFANEHTYKLFNYIVDNWKYPANLKYGYILNFLNSNEKYLPHSKFNLNEKYGFKMGVKYRSEYINFLGKECGFYKDLQPEKAVAKRRYDELLTLYETFREIYV